jgi:lysophospholipase L1-like esterase
MPMRKFGWRNAVFGITALLLAGYLTACDDSGGGGGGLGDVGSNDANVYAAIGDSITEGGNGGGDPYPPRLSAMTGKTVLNYGSGGESSGTAVGQVGSILPSVKPGALLILLGAIDVIEGDSTESTIANLRSIIQQAKANQTVPIIATLLPMRDGHELWAGEARKTSAQIRSLASSEGARLVDLEAEFGTGEGLLLEDGLHPNEVGNQLIADAFAGAL